MDDLLNTVRTIHPLTVALALVAGMGAVLMGTAWGLLCGLNFNLGGKVDLGREANRISGIEPDADSFVARALSPILHAVLARTGENERLWVERTYDLLDRKRGSSEYYTKKIVCAITGFALGILLGLNFADVVPIVVRIAELLAHSQEAGTDLAQALQDIGDRAVDEVESLIRGRGEENSQLMVAPSIIALSGIFIALLGPSMLDLMNFLK